MLVLLGWILHEFYIQTCFWLVSMYLPKVHNHAVFFFHYMFWFHMPIRTPDPVNDVIQKVSNIWLTGDRNISIMVSWAWQTRWTNQLQIPCYVFLKNKQCLQREVTLKVAPNCSTPIQTMAPRLEYLNIKPMHISQWHVAWGFQLIQLIWSKIRAEMNCSPCSHGQEV